MGTELLKPEMSVSLDIRESLRFLGGLIFGVLIGIFLISAIDRGAFFYFVDENMKWNIFSWNHWFFRTLACIFSTFCAALLSGFIVRKSGKVVGVLTTIPSCIFWLLFFWGQFTGYINLGFGKLAVEISITSKIMAIVLIVINIVSGYIGGTLGMEMAEDHSQFIDESKKSLLGIKWYHYLWLPVIVYFILIQGFFTSFYILEKLLFIFKLPEYSILKIIPNLLSGLAYFSLLLTYKSLLNSYKILSGITHCNSQKERYLKLSGYLLGFPILSVLVLQGVFYLDLGIYNLFN